MAKWVELQKACFKTNKEMSLSKTNERRAENLLISESSVVVVLEQLPVRVRSSMVELWGLHKTTVLITWPWSASFTTVRMRWRRWCYFSIFFLSKQRFIRVQGVKFRESPIPRNRNTTQVDTGVMLQNTALLKENIRHLWCNIQTAVRLVFPWKWRITEHVEGLEGWFIFIMIWSV